MPNGNSRSYLAGFHWEYYQCKEWGIESQTKGLSSREAARGHATNVDGEMLSVTINRIYNY